MGGLPRRLTKINEIRTSDSNPLIVDAGDFFFSTTKINIGNKQSEKIRAESILKGYEKIGYDILNVGEYETLVGLPFLKRMSEKVSVPFISANLKDKSTNQLIFDPYKIINRNNLTIAFIGLTNNLADTSNTILMDDYLESGKKYIKEVSSKSDMIVLLVNADRSTQSELVDAFPKVDFIITSGSTNMSRESSPQKEGGPYLYSCGKQGKYLLKVDINIKDPKKPIIDVSHHKKNLVSIDKRFTRLQKKDPSKTLEEIYADQSNVLSLIEKYRNELSESKKIIETAINTIEYKTIGLNRKIKDDPDMLTFVEKALVSCNAYAPKVSEKPKSSLSKKNNIKRKSKIDHSGHSH